MIQIRGLPSHDQLRRLINPRSLCHSGPLSTYGGSRDDYQPVFDDASKIDANTGILGTLLLLNQLEARGMTTNWGVATTFMNNTICSGSRRAFVAMWSDVISEYSKLQLTMKNDRLAAVAGIATGLQSKCETDLRYLVGVWDDSGSQQGDPTILVQTHSWLVSEGRTQRPANRKVPSWSWAAVDGEIMFDVLAPDTQNEDRFCLCRFLRVTLRD